MKLLAIAATTALISCTLFASDGWYRPAAVEHSPLPRVVDGHLVTQIPLIEVEVPVLDVLLRLDSDDKSVYWIIVRLGALIDCEGMYYLSCGDVALTEWKWRVGDAQDECYWAHKCRDLNTARKILAGVAKIHKLEAALVRDQTKANKTE